MSEHTPGKWEVQIAWDGEVFVQPVGVWLGIKGSREAIANARLIAAAPELLAACKMTLRELARYIDDLDEDQDNAIEAYTGTGAMYYDSGIAANRLDATNAYDAVLAALTKARGESD